MTLHQILFTYMCCMRNSLNNPLTLMSTFSNFVLCLFLLLFLFRQLSDMVDAEANRLKEIR